MNVAAAPDWLTRRLLPASSAGQGQRAARDRSGGTEDSLSDSALAVGAWQVTVAAEGRRNQILNNSAYWLHRHTDEHERVDAVLTDAAVHAGLGPDEIPATLASAARAAGDQPSGPRLTEKTVARGALWGLTEAAHPGEAVRQALATPQVRAAVATAARTLAAQWRQTLATLAADDRVDPGDVDALRAAVEGRRGRLRAVGPDERDWPPRLADVLPDASVDDGARVPPGWQMTAERLAHQTGKGMATVAHGPLLLTGRLTDTHEGTEHLRVTWRRDGRWRHRVVQRAVVANSRSLVELSAYGMPVNSGNTRDIVAFVADYEAHNHEYIPHARVSTQMGWQDHAGFLWGRRLIRAQGTGEPLDLAAMDPLDWPADAVAFHGSDAGDNQLADAYQRSGTLEGWRAAVAGLADHPRAALAVYAALTPPLLGLLGAPNFAVDWSNATSTGKTTTLRVAASVWGNPDERESASALGTWDATRVWIERASAISNDLPLLLDDTKRAREPAAVATTLYDVTNGRGRGRGSLEGISRTRSWRTVLLSTGEQPATSFTEDGGTRARTLTVWGPPFGATDQDTGAMVDKLNLDVRRHFGHAGPALITHLLRRYRHRWARQQRGAFKQAQQRWTRRAGGNPVAARLATYFATLDLVGQLTDAALGLPWDHDSVLGGVWDDVAAEVETDPATRALAHVVSWTYAHPHEFWRPQLEGHDRRDMKQDQREAEVYRVKAEQTPALTAAGIAGRWDTEDLWSFVAFYPHRLRQILQQAGYHTADAVLRTWRDRGWLETDGDRKRLTKTVRIHYQARKAYVITRTAFEQTEGY